jgi:hypothetical protein
MTEERHDDPAAQAWACVLQARTPGSKQIPALARRLTDALEREPRCGSVILRLSVAHRLAYRLELLADAAPPNRGGPLHRLAAVARAEQDELDEVWDELDEEDFDGDEMPA